MPHAPHSNAPLKDRLRRCAVAASILAAALTLSACGGGGGDEPSAAFEISVAVGGHSTGGGAIGPGSTQTIYVRAGESIELDASEAVIWTLYIAGTAISGCGTVVSYGGIDVTLTALSPSRIALDTFAAFPLAFLIPLTFVATSTFDSAQVATVTVYVTN
jgi:hypothetical protein